MLQQRYLILKLRQNKSLYGFRCKGSTRVLGFSTFDDALLCKKALVHFKQKHGVWPIHYHHENIQPTDSLENYKDIYKSIEINYAITDDLIDICIRSNLGAIFCDKFFLNEGNLHFKGQQLEARNNFEEFTNNLEKYIN